MPVRFQFYPDRFRVEPNNGRAYCLCSFPIRLPLISVEHTFFERIPSGVATAMRRAMATLPLRLPRLPKPELIHLGTPFRFPFLPPPPPLPQAFFISRRASSLSLACSPSSSSSTSSPLTVHTLPPPPPSGDAPHRVSSGAVDLEPYLGCSMPGRRLRVAVLLSGGVDSSTALRLIHAAGHDCTAFYLKIWFQVCFFRGPEDFENFWSECPWDEDLKYARAVCDQVRCFLLWDFCLSMNVDVPLEVVHLSDEYWNNVIKDQTYFLSHLSQSQLKRLLFPLGCLRKVKFSEFVAKHIGELEGVLLEAETGDYLGNHHGFWFYTIGQRQGLRLPGGPWFAILLQHTLYVVEKDVRNNVVFVSRNYFSLDKRRLYACILTKNLNHQVRHGPGFYDCSIMAVPGIDGDEDNLVVHLSEDDQGLAAGQFAAFYHGDVCIGSGVIMDSWDEKCFPICSKALEIARMEDKSKLGKPVRIMNLDTR
ncbi:hypothetical protein B296_00042876 [Ensete ventricosum]|uniref:Uncharacterized protein n=1 Tax=Ensete ventricosum TaxID=4639 RepID=A0A426ZGQ9_ENSVE|nr:hypothetical protein B296_00042876 [Ensete ventricosum]